MLYPKSYTIKFTSAFKSIKMERALNYKFKRRSTNYYEWLYYVIDSEKFNQADAIVIMEDISNSYLPNEGRLEN